MKYLVLTRFRTYGKQLEKGMVVDESEIRSPLLRMSEGKIVPAVSSSTVPAEPGDDVTSDPASQGVVGSEDKGSSEPEGENAPEAEAEKPKEQPKKPLLSFGKKG